MPIRQEDLLRLRPFVYHTSGRANFASIRRDRELRSTALLLRGTPYERLLRARRLYTAEVMLPSGPVSIRDQQPLRPGSIWWEAGCDLPTYLDELNRRVFFWLGTSRGPNPRGAAHHRHIAHAEDVFTLRVALRSLLAANEGRPAFVTCCNSGSARHNRGRPVARGLITFRRLHQADFPPSKAIELSFCDRARLPDDVEFGGARSWQPLWPVG